MNKQRGFLEFDRIKPERRSVEERIKDWKEFEGELPAPKIREQAARCMDCGTPFCHTGCPLGNIIPDWNDMVYHDRWKLALSRLHSTNNFPEFTGRVCPAPCEESCTLNIDNSPVNIKLIERQISTRAWDEGYVTPVLPRQKSGKRVAIVGSGPAGMACAQQLARAGHDVTLFERAPKIGGLLRYGIPDFKLEKHFIDRRVDQMIAEGVTMRTGVNVGVDVSADELASSFDAVVLAGGSTVARDIPWEGRELKGIHPAMDYLSQQNRVVDGESVPEQILATGKKVVVLGGGDTGADCVGTAIRQGAESVLQIELLDRPPTQRTDEMPWPYWPMTLRTSSSHEEGAQREWSINTKRFSGNAQGVLQKLHGIRLEWTVQSDGRKVMREVEGSEFAIDADLVFLAMGFVGPEKAPLLSDLKLELDEQGNVRTNHRYQTSRDHIFSCGDMRRGQSLVVWAIWEGRQSAAAVDAYLSGRSYLPVTPNTAPLQL